MEISGKKSIQTIVEDPSLRKHIKVIYLLRTQEQLIKLCGRHRINFVIKPKEFFNTHYSNKIKYKYKYAIAVLKSIPTLTLDQLIDIKVPGLIVALDHIHDPFNLGAILRSCSAAGAKGAIIPKSKQAPINHETVLKASQGYSLKTNVVLVSNLHQAILALKRKQYFIYSAALEDGSKDFRQVQYPQNSVLVLGNEGEGVSELLKKESDALIHIPMQNKVDSLNVSVAAGILMFEMTKS